MTTLNKLLLTATLALAPALAGAQTILIDFGDEATQTTGVADTWNNAHLGIVGSGDTGTLFADMVDTTNSATGITLSITNAFDGRNANGFGSPGFNPAGTAPYPTSATQDSFYTATATASVTPGDGLGVFEFTGLDVTKSYVFTFFGSRQASNNRETEYTLTGSNSESVYLNTGSNISETVTASAVNPTAGGVITLSVQAGPNNESDYSYIGAVEIAVIPEPSSMALLAGAMVTGLVILRRRQ